MFGRNTQSTPLTPYVLSTARANVGAGVANNTGPPARARAATSGASERQFDGAILWGCELSPNTRRLLTRA